MHVLYDDDGHLRVATVFESQDGALTIESPPPHRKRSKLRSDRVLLQFPPSALSGVALDALLPQAQTVADSIDLEFLWQCVGRDELLFSDLAGEYFGHTPSPIEAAAVLLRLQSGSSHFHRRGRGRFQAATESEIAAAKVAAARRADRNGRISALAEALERGELPREIAARLPGILYRPDGSSVESKAVEQAASRLRIPPAQLFLRCGALKDARDYHLGRFLFENFPKGRDPILPAGPLFDPPAGLPQAQVVAFSIDDVTTTEVDDAFSVTRLPSGQVQVGIHIAAPALGFLPDSPTDAIARARLSTVYMPGDKITMLPEGLIQAFSLDEGRSCPALSLYLTVAGDGSYRILGTDTRVESVPIAKNLRYPHIDEIFDEAALARGGEGVPFGSELCFLYRLTTALWEARGKGEMDKTDFLFYVDNTEAGESLRILPRKRGAPSDRIVSELMIYVNSTWGKLLGDRDVHALFRVQDGGKVRMSLYPAPHLSLGVAQYLWSSSPLRRYVDLINQWLLLSVVYGEPSPFEGRDADLQSIVREVELTTPVYDEFQKNMERYYSLRYLQQEDLRETTAVVVKDRDNLVRFERVPIWGRVASLPELPVGTVVRLAVSRIDLFDLTLHCEYRP
jgi:exoribonuclease-2